jgi:hypothetical protein
MNLLMTGGMKQYSVLCVVWTPFGSPKKMMAVPSCNFGDLLVANRAESLLLLPQVDEPSFPFEPGHHLNIQAFLKIRFPGRVIRISFGSDFRVSLDANRRSSHQPHHSHLLFLLLEDACENPTVRPFIGKVFVLDPSARFVPMSSACPSPDGLEDSMINVVKDLFTNHMAVIERPAPNHRVEFCNQFACGEAHDFL